MNEEKKGKPKFSRLEILLLVILVLNIADIITRIVKGLAG